MPPWPESPLRRGFLTLRGLSALAKRSRGPRKSRGYVRGLPRCAARGAERMLVVVGNQPETGSAEEDVR
jgi:hypothetical protein